MTEEEELREEIKELRLELASLKGRFERSEKDIWAYVKALNEVK